MVVATTEMHRLAAPQPRDDLESLVSGTGTLRRVATQPGELLRPVAAPDAEFEAAAGQDVDGGAILGHAHRVVQG